MSGWSQYLYTKRKHSMHDSSKLDGHNALTTTHEDEEPWRRHIDASGEHVRLSTPGQRSAFIQDCGDRWCVAITANISDVPGVDSDYAREQTIVHGGEKRLGRYIQFTHLYFTPKGNGAKIPDLDELLEKQALHLEEILRRAHPGEGKKGEEYVDIAKAQFDRPRKPGTEWDRIATEMERKHGKVTDFGKGYAFNASGAKIYDLPDPDPVAIGLTELKAAKKAAQGAEKAAENATRKFGFREGAGVTAAVLALGAIGWAVKTRMNHAQPSRQEQVAR